VYWVWNYLYIYNTEELYWYSAFVVTWISWNINSNTCSIYLQSVNCLLYLSWFSSLWFSSPYCRIHIWWKLMVTLHFTKTVPLFEFLLMPTISFQMLQFTQLIFWEGLRMSHWVPLICLPTRGCFDLFLGDFDINISKNFENWPIFLGKKL
jgi:hypothetical protein